jgi:lipopolysaccharide biosynthesis glycosyltransferase
MDDIQRHRDSSAAEPIHVAIAFDSNYLMPFFALLNSILFNRRRSIVHLHLIVSGLSDQDKDDIKHRAAKDFCEVQFYYPDLLALDSLVLSGTWTTSVYYRLLFPFVVDKSVKRLLYLDCDTLVLGDLSQLYYLNLEGYAVAAVADSYVPVQPLIGITEPGQYFNSGVLLMDLDLWNEMRISQRTLEYLESFPERIRFVDQCGLNAILKGAWLKIDNRFNLLYSSIPPGLGKKEALAFLQDTLIVHFTLQRPWNMLCKSPLRFLYVDYLRRAKKIEFSYQAYSDFSLGKVPAWLHLRLTEFYLSKPFLRRIRGVLK